MSKILPAAAFNLNGIAVGNLDWITAVFLVILIFITLEFTLYRRKMTLLIQSLFSPRHFSQLTREGKIFNERIFILNIGMIFLTQALFVYAIVELFFPGIYSQFQPPVVFLIALGAVIIDYLYKITITYTFCYLFDYEEERSSYYLYKLFYSTINSLFLFLILLIVFYTGFWQILLIYIPVFIVTFVSMSFRVFTLNTKKINPFHFFIYFCTFEILPYLVVVKILFLLEQ